MDYNYHTHTTRCNHATGTEREYIEHAIRAGIRHLGFSEHIPLLFPDGHESFFRLPLRDTEEYVSTIRHLADEYRDRIAIHVGFEMEYYPAYFDTMLETAKRAGAEYLLLGQHFIENESPLYPSSSTPCDSEWELCRYVDALLAGIGTGVFTYVAHPDVFSFTGDPAVYKREMSRLCEGAARSGTPFEINFLGIRARRRYPYEPFWQIAGEYGVPVTFGMDAHAAPDAGDTASKRRAMELVEAYHLNYIGAPRLVAIAE